jgi:hypothetical protein
VLSVGPSVVQAGWRLQVPQAGTLLGGRRVISCSLSRQTHFVLSVQSEHSSKLGGNSKVQNAQRNALWNSR